MACWQELYKMLLDEQMSAYDIVEKLAVKPSRLKRMLESKRLAARLRMVESVVDRRAAHVIIAAVDTAMPELSKLTRADKPETARRACLDVIATAKQVYREQKQHKWPPLSPAGADRQGSAAADRLSSAAARPVPAEGDSAARTKPAASQEADRAAGEPARSPGPGEVAPAAAAPPGDGRQGPPRKKREGKVQMTLESFEAMVAERRRWREQIKRHGGERIARLIQSGRLEGRRRRFGI